MEELPLPGWDTLDFGLGVPELTVSKAVEEYLHYNGYHKTLSTFKGEIRQSQKYNLPRQQPRLVSPEACLAAFDEGNEEAFFNTWNRVVPGGLGQLHALEVKLRVQFAIFPIQWSLRSNHKDSAVPKPNFDLLREFLETYPPRYRKQADCGSLLYYALLYVELPHLHPDFTHLFETKWIQQLRKESEDVLVHFFAQNQDNRRPMIYAICDGIGHRSLSRHSEKSEPVMRDILHFVDQTIQSAQNWMEGEDSVWKQAPTWLDRAKQKVEGYRRIALASRESRIGSRAVSRALYSRQSLYSRYGPRPTRSQGRVSTAGGARGRARRQTPLPNDTLGPLPRTDFVRIAEILSKEIDNIQDLSPLFVSLLRHCSSVYEPLPQRRTFLHAICCFDIFNFELPEFLEEWTVRMFSLDATVALIAVLACEEKGRTYLQKKVETVVKGLMQHLSTKGNTELQAIVALQRLSLRRPLQICMVEHGMIEWTLSELNAGATQNAFLSDITLEFGSALLMNLALRTVGKERMEHTKALEILVPLVDHSNAQVRTQANGTIYSLLSSPACHTAAKKCGLENILRRVMKDEDEIHVKQVEYLLDILAKGPKAELGESDQDDIDDECFLEEEELSAWAIPDAPISSNDFLSRQKDFDSRGPSSWGEQKFQEFISNSDVEKKKMPTPKQPPQAQQQPKPPLSQRTSENCSDAPRRRLSGQNSGQKTQNYLKRKEKVSRGVSAYRETLKAPRP